MNTEPKTIHLSEGFGERPVFRQIYSDTPAQLDRWQRLFDRYQKKFGGTPSPRFFSSPGRAELCGNHTDHNGGLVLAAAVNLDSIAVAGTNDSTRVTIFAEGYDAPFEIDLDDLEPVENERGITTALIRGIASQMDALGYNIGGFDAYITSDVLVGSGLSSSASVEVLIASIFSALFNGSSIDPVTLAVIGQFAENNFFGKPCGLMDQIACAVGGVVVIDFKNQSEPLVNKVTTGFSESDQILVIVNTGGSHADLTEDYAAIPQEMAAVANAFGKQRLIELTANELYTDLNNVRSKVGDRAILRAIHFLEENQRVTKQVQALEAGDLETFRRLANESGDSSWRLLQNCYSPHQPREQGVALALTLTKRFISELGTGACRVQGGGFAGTIQAWLPKGELGRFVELMEPVFGKNCVVAPSIREVGALEIV